MFKESSVEEEKPTTGEKPRLYNVKHLKDIHVDAEQKLSIKLFDAP
jgi:hypothetical protein